MSASFPQLNLIILVEKLVKNNDNSISISLSKEYCNKLLEPFGLNTEHNSSLTTTLSKRPSLDSTSPLTREQHHQYRQSVGQLLWLGLVRPDLQRATRDLNKHLVISTQLDLQQPKLCFRYIKGTQHYQLHLRPQPPLGIHLRLPTGQRIPLLNKFYSDSDWARDINTLPISSTISDAIHLK